MRERNWETTTITDLGLLDSSRLAIIIISFCATLSPSVKCLFQSSAGVIKIKILVTMKHRRCHLNIRGLFYCEGD